MISKFCRDAGVIQGERLDIVVKIVKLLLGIRLKELVKLKDLFRLFIYLGGKDRDYLIAVDALLSVEKHFPVLLEILLFLIFVQFPEHSAGFHIVAVDDQVGRQRIHTAVCIQNQASVLIAAPVKSPAEIIIFTVYDRFRVSLMLPRRTSAI